MSDMFLHFSIGPVQSFVSQARRTRDFWAGSFLLSWMVGVTVAFVKRAGGEIVFPKPDEEFMKWIEGKKGEEPPKIGNLPNQFKARVSDDFDAKGLVADVQAVWKALAEMVWKENFGSFKFSRTCSKEEDVREIWDRQVENFWEIYWVLTEKEDGHRKLAYRKNVRSYFPPEESGIKCLIMEGWQELSGLPYPDKKKLDSFWNEVRNKCGYDIRSDEHLCAIAFIKRRFAGVFHNFNHNKIRGWELSSGVPSVSYLATVHWLEEVSKTCSETTAREFVGLANKFCKGYGEWKTDISCLKGLYEDEKKISSLDGNIFFDTQLENKNLYPDPCTAGKVKKALHKIQKEVNAKPSPFYAVLLMDGDQLGKFMGKATNQEKISCGLDVFTKKVPDIVYKNNGFLIYAGGDDVLAILPLEDALTCASDLRKFYNETFHAKDILSTLSGGIVFAHIKTPLTQVLREAHVVLDDVAKEGRGRDAIAVRVLKPGGESLTWGMPWDKALDENGEVILERLARKFEKDSEVNSDFSTKFLYRLRDFFDLFEEGSGFEKEDTEQVLLAEYLHSEPGGERKTNNKEAKKVLADLLEQCAEKTRKVNDKGKPFPKEQWGVMAYKADAALLVRFLAQKGLDR